jgi:hypothetical protein
VLIEPTQQQRPVVGWRSPVSNEPSVDLPPPELPLTRTRSPRRMVKLQPRSTVRTVAYWKPTSRATSSPRAPAAASSVAVATTAGAGAASSGRPGLAPNSGRVRRQASHAADRPGTASTIDRNAQ